MLQCLSPVSGKTVTYTVTISLNLIGLHSSVKIPILNAMRRHLPFLKLQVPIVARSLAHSCNLDFILLSLVLTNLTARFSQTLRGKDI